MLSTKNIIKEDITGVSNTLDESINSPKYFLKWMNTIIKEKHPTTSVSLQSIADGVLHYDEITGISENYFGGEMIDVLLEDIEEYQLFIGNIQSKILKFLESINNADLNKDFSLFMKAKVDFLLGLCDLSLCAVYFEAEKGTSSYKIPFDKRGELLERVKNHSEKLRGGEVLSRESEYESIISYLGGLDYSGGGFEKENMLNFLQEMGVSNRINHPKNLSYDSDFMKKIIDRESYAEIFEINFEIQGFDVIYLIKKPIKEPIEFGIVYYFPEEMSENKIMKYLVKKGVLGKKTTHKKVIMLASCTNMTAVTSIGYNYSGIKIPDSIEYDEITVGKLCDYLDHEIALHGYRGHSHVQGVQQSSANYLKTEEGLAIMNELLVKESPQNLVYTPTEHSITKLICECLPGDEAKIVIYAYYLAEGLYHGKEREKAKNRVIRLKRNGPIDMPYAHAKDNAYNIYTESFIKELMRLSLDELEDKARKLYSGKRGKEDIGIIESLNKQFGFDGAQQKLPLMLGKLIAVRASGIDHKLLKDPNSTHYDPRFLLDTNRDKEILIKILEAENLIQSYAYAPYGCGEHIIDNEIVQGPASHGKIY